MTNIEAMTIGALARLRHQLDHDVARHLGEMAEHSAGVKNTLQFHEQIEKGGEPIAGLFYNGGLVTSMGGTGGACGPMPNHWNPQWVGQRNFFAGHNIY